MTFIGFLVIDLNVFTKLNFFRQSMDSAWGPSGHYVNYEEIQQNLK